MTVSVGETTVSLDSAEKYIFTGTIFNFTLKIVYTALGIFYTISYTTDMIVRYILDMLENRFDGCDRDDYAPIALELNMYLIHSHLLNDMNSASRCSSDRVALSAQVLVLLYFPIMLFRLSIMTGLIDDDSFLRGGMVQAVAA